MELQKRVNAASPLRPVLTLSHSGSALFCAAVTLRWLCYRLRLAFYGVLANARVANLLPHGGKAYGAV